MRSAGCVANAGTRTTAGAVRADGWRTCAEPGVLADAIAKRRYAESQKWAQDGPGIVVPLRRSRY